MTNFIFGRKPNPEWNEYVLNYNVMYHDYGMSDDAIVAQLGPEPPRYITPAPQYITNALAYALDELADLDATQDDASGRKGY